VTIQEDGKALHYDIEVTFQRNMCIHFDIALGYIQSEGVLKYYLENAFYPESYASSSQSVFLHGLGRLTCSGVDALPSFPRASTISSSSRLVVEGVCRKSGVVHSLKMVDPVLIVFGSHVMYSRYLEFSSYNFASYFV
jgi:hypothetical protein